MQKNAVTSAKVKDGSLLLKDFKPGHIPVGPKGDAGKKGDPGTKGSPGERGPVGPAGPAGPTFGTAMGRKVPFLQSTINGAIAVLRTTLPTTSRLMIFGQPGRASAECPRAVACVIDLALYVDGQPVPGAQSYRPEPGGVTPEVLPTIFGLTPKLASGEHTVELRFVSADSGVLMRADASASLGVVGLGSE